MQKSWKHIHKFMKISGGPQAESHLNKKGKTMSLF